MISPAIYIKNKNVFTVSSVQKKGTSKYKGLGKEANQNLKCTERQKQAFSKYILKKSLTCKEQAREQCVIACPKLWYRASYGSPFLLY